jgi:hypothetical protein
MLNNNRPSDLIASLTLYTPEGTAIPLPDVPLTADESKLIDFGTILRLAHIDGPLGFIRVTYSGLLTELGAQLTLYPVVAHNGLDSPRSLSTDSKSTRLSAVAWAKPGSRAVVSLTNPNPNPVIVSLRSGDETESMDVAPNHTVIRRIPVDRDRPGGVKPFAIDINYQGAPNAIRAFGFIENAGDDNIPIRFYDPDTATSKDLTAVGLELNEVPHVSILNLTSQPVNITPALAAVSNSAPNISTGATTVLGPHEAVEVPVQGLLSSYAANGATRVTLTIKTDAPIGGIIGAVSQIDSKTGVMEDLPLKTGNPARFMRGAYPLRWDQDYSNQPMISNTSDHTFSVRAYVIAKGVTYAFPIQDIAPGFTKLYDVDTLRRNGTKDVNGKVIPADALSGKFHWGPVGSDGFTGLLGRTELASQSDQRASSFSCSEVCDLESYYYPYFTDDLLANLDYQQVRQMSITEAYYDGYGNYVTYPVALSNSYLFSSNTSIINFAVDGEDSGSQSLIDETGANYGSSTLSYYFISHSYSGPPVADPWCDYYDNAVYYSNTITITDNTPIITGIDPSDWTAGTTQLVTFTGQHFGTDAPNLNFDPGSGITYSLLSYNDSEIQAYVTVDGSTPNEDVDVSVTSSGYNGNGFMSGGGQVSPTALPASASVSKNVPTINMSIKFWGGKSPDDQKSFPSSPLCSQNLGLFPCSGQSWFWNVEGKGVVSDDASNWTVHQSLTGRRKGYHLSQTTGTLLQFDDPINEPDDGPLPGNTQQPSGQNTIYWIDGPGAYVTNPVPDLMTYYQLTQVMNFVVTYCNTLSPGDCHTQKWHLKLVVSPGGILDWVNTDAGLGLISTNF